MTRNDLSTEQQDLVRLALEGKNVLCDACIGSGKTSTINVLCNEFDSSKQILYLILLALVQHLHGIHLPYVQRAKRKRLQTAFLLVLSRAYLYFIRNIVYFVYLKINLHACNIPCKL